MEFEANLDTLNALARVPEHSLRLMQGMSGGEPFCIGPYFFLADADWLLAIAYPLKGAYRDSEFAEALKKALARSGASRCWAIGAKLPQSMREHLVDSDRFYLLSTSAPAPPRLRGPLHKASQQLKISEGSSFTPAHRKLWGEFLGQAQGADSAPMHARVQELYARTPQALRSGAGQIRLLDAVCPDGCIAASLLLDYSPQKFTSYILGAHSRENYVPHAADLLFWEMLRRSRALNKRFIHLGLGVNPGILRFKLKWGAKAYLPYLMSEWTEKRRDQGIRLSRKQSNAPHSPGQDLVLALLRSSGKTKRDFLDTGSSQRPFAMLWELRKNNRVSWIGGTAHFFCYSFESSFRSLFKKVDRVIFEAPLDENFMNQVDQAGKTLPAYYRPLIDMLSEDEIRQLERVVRGPEGALARALGLECPRKLDVRWHLEKSLPWNAFFSLWTAFLERMGWRDSVDMEAWRLAHEMGKEVLGMESLEEQLASLNSLPIERVLRFFRACKGWRSQSRKNMNAYLAGDLEQMMGSSAEFPTRTEHVVSRRDPRFLERMLPYLEEGGCAVFVGAAHLVNLRWMLAEEGFSVRQTPFGILPKARLWFRNKLRNGEDLRW